MNIKYILSEKDNHFGICAVDISNNNSIEEIEDISLDKRFVEELIEKFNLYGLSIVHFKDAVMDSLE